jgi:hypothetical protein
VLTVSMIYRLVAEWQRRITLDRIVTYAPGVSVIFQEKGLAGHVDLGAVIMECGRNVGRCSSCAPTDDYEDRRGTGYRRVDGPRACHGGAEATQRGGLPHAGDLHRPGRRLREQDETMSNEQHETPQPVDRVSLTEIYQALPEYLAVAKEPFDVEAGLSELDAWIDEHDQDARRGRGRAR